MNPREKVNTNRKLDVKTRQGTIIDILNEEEISSLDDLIESLKERGIEISKPTVSRDIKELDIKKNHKGHLTLPISEHISKHRLELKALLDDNVLAVSNEIDFYTIKVNPGKAQSAAFHIEEVFGDKIMGTMIGLNYVIVLLAMDGTHYSDLIDELNELTGAEVIE